MRAEPSDIDDPERQRTPCQTDQAREDFSVILDELAFPREQLARLPIRAEVRWIVLRAALGTLAAIVAIAKLV
jgi:hypothetical protein